MQRETPAALRYVALGDSYTIGTSVSEPERWPEQLVAALGPDAPALTLLANLGIGGYTSGDLIRDELPELDRLAPEFVTLLIGVNDVVQGVPAATYEANLALVAGDGLHPSGLQYRRWVERIFPVMERLLGR